MTSAGRAMRAAVVAIACATAAPDALHGQVFAGLSPDSLSGVRGQQGTVALFGNMGTTGTRLGSYSVTITWDSTVVRIDSVRAGNAGNPLVNYVNGGEVRLAQVIDGGIGGTFTIALLYGRIVNDTIGRRTPITLSFTDFVDTAFTDLRPDLTIVHGVARVLPPSVVVHFTPDSTYERVGHKPVIDVTADLSQATGVALGSYAASLTWDPGVMAFDSVSAGDYVLPQHHQSAPGELRLSAADAQGRAGAFSLARIHFTYLNDTFPRVSTLALTVTEMAAAATFANLLPGVTTRIGKAVIGGVLRGDTNIDGAIAALDAQLILQGAVGLTLSGGLPGLPHGDADCSGTLQARDAQIVLNRVVGNPVGQFCVAKIQ